MDKTSKVLFGLLGAIGLSFLAYKVFGKPVKKSIPGDELHRIFKKPFYDLVVSRIKGKTFQEITDFVVNVGNLQPDPVANVNHYPIIAELFGIRFDMDPGIQLAESIPNSDYVFNPGMRDLNGDVSIKLNIYGQIHELSIGYQIRIIS